MPIRVSRDDLHCAVVVFLSELGDHIQNVGRPILVK